MRIKFDDFTAMLVTIFLVIVVIALPYLIFCTVQKDEIDYQMRLTKYCAEEGASPSLCYEIKGKSKQ